MNNTDCANVCNCDTYHSSTVTYLSRPDWSGYNVPQSALDRIEVKAISENWRRLGLNQPR